MSDRAGDTAGGGAELEGGTGARALVRPLVRFAVVQGVLIAVIATVLCMWVWRDAAGRSAVRASAYLAFVTQMVTFAIARLVAREQVMAAWVLGIFIRFVTVAAWAFLGTRALGLPLGPALLSLVSFYFVSTLIEPLFLNG